MQFIECILLSRSQILRGSMLVCLFVCLRFPYHSRISSLIWRRHHYWWKAANFDLNVCSALIAIEQWGFFSVPHLLWHKSSVYNGHLRGQVTVPLIAERWAVELSLLPLSLKATEKVPRMKLCIIYPYK